MQHVQQAHLIVRKLLECSKRLAPASIMSYNYEQHCQHCSHFLGQMGLASWQSACITPTAQSSNYGQARP